MNLKKHFQKIINKDSKPPLVTLRIYKRHILVGLIVIILAIMGYAAYFRFYMVLPQSTVNVMPVFPYPLDNQKILVISPHCDDESLGSAGLIQQSLAGKSEVRVDIITDCNYHEIGPAREAESKSALSLIGVTDKNIGFLNFPERNSNKKTNHDNLTVKEAIDKEIGSFQPTLIISPHPDDTNIDHKTAGVAVRELLSEKYSDIKVAYYLIHYNFMRFPNPPGLHSGDYLMPPARIVTFSQRWYILPLSQDQENDKQDAILQYKSQLSLKNPILHEILLDFVRKNELFMIPN